MSISPLPKDMLVLIFLDIEPQSIVNVKCVNKRCAAICQDHRFKTLYKEKWKVYFELWKKIKNGNIRATSSKYKDKNRKLLNIINDTLSHSTSPSDWKKRMIAAIRPCDDEFSIKYYSNINTIELRDGGNRVWIVTKYNETRVEKKAIMDFVYSIVRDLETLLYFT